MKGLIIAVITAALTSSSCYFREQNLRNKGDQVIAKIESFHKERNRLPHSLADIGIEDKEEGPIHYHRTSDTTYQIWFGTSLGESVTYDSEKREWSP